MQYVFNRKLNPDFSHAQTALVTLLPALAAAVLIVALFSSSTYSAAGKEPYIQTAAASSHKAVQPSSRHPAHNPAAAPPAAAGNPQSAPAPSVPTAAPPSLSTATLSGGYGGGDGTTPSSGSTNPLQTTVTTPPLNVSAGGKDILTIPSTPITVN